MHLKYKLLGGFKPTKDRPSDAGLDLKSPVEIVVPAKDFVFIDLKLALEIPNGFYGTIESRSGLGKRGLQCHRGIIDSGYRGSIGVVIFNHGQYDYHVHAGDRICQLILHRQECISLEEVSELSESDRGSAGFGSSGR